MRDWLDHSVYEFIEEITGVKGAREQLDGQRAKLEHVQEIEFLTH